jgi:hypothetical protein
MPAQTIPVDLSAAGRTPIVPNGNFINAVSVLPPATGAPFNFTFDLGNRQLIGPITMDGKLKLTGKEKRDNREGLVVVNAIAQPGVIVPIVVSYSSEYEDDASTIEYGSN